MQKVFMKPTVPYKLLLEKFAMDMCKAILMIRCEFFSSESENDFGKLEIFFNFSLKCSSGQVGSISDIRTREFCSKSAEAELHFESIQFLHSQKSL